MLAMKHLLAPAAALLLFGCPAPAGLDDDDSGSAFDDDDATADDDDATADDDDSTADDDDSTGDDDDSTGDDDDSTGDDDDTTGDDDDSSPADGPISFDVGLSCGSSVATTNVGHSNQADGYAACGLPTTGLPGGEYVAISGAANVQHTLTLTWIDTAFDLDLIVLDGNNPTTSGCIASSAASTGTMESVVFTLASGNAWIVIDSKDPVGTSFDLSLTCP